MLADSGATPQEPCGPLGTWNPVLRQCICAIGRNGSRCEQLSLPACRASVSSTAVSCPVGRPQHCDCHEQCLSNGAFAAHMYRYCFRHAGATRTPLSSIPPRHEPASFFECRDGRCTAVSRETALRHEFVASLEHVPAERCPGRCSERGACVSERGRASGGHCRCDPYYFGAGCSRHESRWCWNGCAKRGKCVDGFCVCRPPYYGPGCALGSEGDDGGDGGDLVTASGSGGGGRGSDSGGGGGGGGGDGGDGFRVHVYDLPPLVLRRRTYGSDPDPIFNTHHVWLEALLRDAPRRLAARAEAARAFVVPAFGTNMEGLLEYYVHAQRHVAAAAPWWRRRRGADHVWFTTADGGGCELNGHPKLRRSVILAHYLKLNTSSPSSSSSSSLSPRAGADTSCGARGKDVAVPPAVPAVSDGGFLARGERPTAARPLAFFFAGNVPDTWQPGFDNRTDDDLSREAYSEGVRQLVWKHLRRHRSASTTAAAVAAAAAAAAGRYLIVPRSPSYLTDWGDSQVCLAPMGVGWGVRLLWAIGGGCVPLLASSEVASWFDDALDYRAFSLVGVPKAALPTLPTLLERLGAAALQAKQVELLRRRPLFLWARADSAARHAAATTHGGGGGGGGGGGAFAYATM